MARDWPRLAVFQTEADVSRVTPKGWTAKQIEDLFEKLDIGKRFDQKSCGASGSVPVVDQSAAGFVGFHNDAPGVQASKQKPVVTFANHTCEMRVMRRAFSVIQNVFPMVGKRGVCETLFFYYTSKGRVHLEEYKGHYPDFRRLWIPLPPLPEQRAIASVLGALDDKIDLNRRMCQTLEEMARALFKSWFVDFDPVRAKMEGRDPGLPKEIADLFPSRLVDSELGPIPEGWRASSFGALVCQRTERVGEREAVVLSAVASGNLVRSDDHFTKRVYSQETTKYLVVEQWDIAYNPSRINIGSVGMLKEDVFGGVSPVYVVARPAPAYRWLLEFFLRRPWSKAWINTLASGSVRQSLSFADFASIPCVVPPEAFAQEFNRLWHTFYEGICAHESSSRTLAALRDTLLPKLISGELRVPASLGSMQEVAT